LEEISQGVYQQGIQIGCPVDSDQDSVPDYLDKCPKNRPLEIEKGIDSHGCSLDTDKDGIPDYLDVCFENVPKK
jgi:OOP family OmpA-OmpF porin